MGTRAMILAAKDVLIKARNHGGSVVRAVLTTKAQSGADFL
jgi:hypothetical protein